MFCLYGLLVPFVTLLSDTSLSQMRYDVHMVRKSELKETSATTKVIAEAVSALMNERDMSQNRLAKIIGKSQSYVSTRTRGEQPWTTDDIDAIAKALGLPNGFTILDRARGLSSR